MKQVLLLRHGATKATERRAFGADEPLTDAATEAATRLGCSAFAGATGLTSPKLRCRQTAAAAGLVASVDPDLTECAFGSWEGRTFAEIESAEPELVGGWLADPAAAPPGGESLNAFSARVGAWLQRSVHSPDVVLAVTHAGWIKAAVATALGAPVQAFWRIEVDPLSLTELHAHGERWSVVRTNWTPQR